MVVCGLARPQPDGLRQLKRWRPASPCLPVVAFVWPRSWPVARRDRPGDPRHRTRDVPSRWRSFASRAASTCATSLMPFGGGLMLRLLARASSAWRGDAAPVGSGSPPSAPRRRFQAGLYPHALRRFIDEIWRRRCATLFRRDGGRPQPARRPGSRLGGGRSRDVGFDMRYAGQRSSCDRGAARSEMGDDWRSAAVAGSHPPTASRSSTPACRRSGAGPAPPSREAEVEAPARPNVDPGLPRRDRRRSGSICATR